MKVIATLALFCIATQAFAATMDMKSTMAALMSVKVQAQDAVDDALNVLKDLIRAQQDEQAAHDASYAREKARIENTLAQLEDRRQRKRAECDDSKAHVDFVQDEITDTQSHLDFIAKRVATINQQRIDLHDGRCESNQVFIQSLREHRDALDVIDFLIQDLQTYQAELNAGASLAQVSSTVDKLRAFSYLFKTGTLNEFLQLADPKAEAELTDGTKQRSAEDIGTGHEDNDKEALKLKQFESGTDDRNVVGGSAVERIIGLLNALQQHLRESMTDLETNEIRAAIDLANWLDKTEDELAELAADKERKTKYLQKLEVDLETAQNVWQQCENEYQQILEAIATNEAELERRTNEYHSETERRNNEITLIEECIKIFQERISSMQDFLANQAL